VRLRTGSWIAGITFPLLMLATPRLTADIVPDQPTAKVSITFDDGYDGTMQAAQILAKKGLVGTAYIVPSYIGQPEYMTWEQVAELQNTYKWEIGAHSLTHPELSRLDDSKIEYELAQSKHILADHGFTAKNFATPFGDYDNRVIAAAARHYRSHRAFHNTGTNAWPYNNYMLQVQHVEGNKSTEIVKASINDAVKNKTGIIFVFHQLKATPSIDPEQFEYGLAPFEEIAEYLVQNKIDVVTVDKFLNDQSLNLLPTDSLDNGINQGWWTDDPQNIRFDNQGKGVWPNPQSSIRLQSRERETHLFSPHVAVTPGRTYGVKAFLATERIAPGKQIGFYVDEYNAQNQWISGRYLARSNEVYVEEVNFRYSPTSTRIKSARLQVIVEGNSNAVAYLAAPKWLPL
jgi:peptidoglycan/xylan/chitin deacetylase (PgdA/CDA1 family)